MFELSDVTKRYGNITAVRHLSLSIPPEDTTVLIGPSGCGKSTTLRLLIRLIEPDRGTLTFDGSDLTELDAQDYRRKIGYVIQEGGLFPHLTARENIVLMAEYLQYTEEDISDRLEELMALTDFDRELLTSYPGELSGGQRQRVSFMRGLFLDPAALLLDEPLGALDPMIRSSMQKEVKDIFQRLNKTVVLVTHNMDEAVFFADHIVLMKDGTIIQKGTFDELVEEPADPFVREFINSQKSFLEQEDVRS